MSCRPTEGYVALVVKKVSSLVPGAVVLGLAAALGVVVLGLGSASATQHRAAGDRVHAFRAALESGGFSVREGDTGEVNLVQWVDKRYIVHGGQQRRSDL